MKRIAFIAICIFLTAIIVQCQWHKAVYGSLIQDKYGATVQFLTTDSNRAVYLIFTADSMFEGGNYALDILKDKNCKASFFFTGNFLRDSVSNGAVIRRAIDEGHYVGPHGDRHILLADWNDERSTLVDADSALADMKSNLSALSVYGVDTLTTRYVVPSFEWYNRVHTEAFARSGMITIGLTPGFTTYLDFTTPDMPKYCSADSIWHSFSNRLKDEDISGSIILIHLGTSDLRQDKFYRYLPQMIDSLCRYGYKVRALPTADAAR